MKKLIATLTISLSIMTLLTCAAFAADKDQDSAKTGNTTHLASQSSMWGSDNPGMKHPGDNGKGNGGMDNGMHGNGNRGHGHGHDVSDY